MDEHMIHSPVERTIYIKQSPDHTELHKHLTASALHIERALKAIDTAGNTDELHNARTRITNQRAHIKALEADLQAERTAHSETASELHKIKRSYRSTIAKIRADQNALAETNYSAAWRHIAMERMTMSESPNDLRAEAMKLATHGVPDTWK